MKNIPTEKELAIKVKLVEVKVKGRYIARVNEKSTLSKNYEVTVLMPEGFILSDVKRHTPKAIKEKYEDFVTMRDFYPQDKGKKTDKVVSRRDLYSDYELERFKKIRDEERRAQAEEQKMRKRIGVGTAADTSDYDAETGLPPLVEP